MTNKHRDGDSAGQPSHRWTSTSKVTFRPERSVPRRPQTVGNRGGQHRHRALACGTRQPPATRTQSDPETNYAISHRRHSAGLPTCIRRSPGGPSLTRVQHLKRSPGWVVLSRPPAATSDPRQGATTARCPRGDTANAGPAANIRFADSVRHQVLLMGLSVWSPSGQCPAKAGPVLLPGRRASTWRPAGRTRTTTTSRERACPRTS